MFLRFDVCRGGGGTLLFNILHDGFDVTYLPSPYEQTDACENHILTQLCVQLKRHLEVQPVSGKMLQLFTMSLYVYSFKYYLTESLLFLFLKNSILNTEKLSSVFC